MNIINPYRFAAPAGGGLLDTYTGASAAFSLRELSSAWAGQAVVRVQRTGGDEADFTAAEVSDGTLVTWVEGGTGGAGTNDGYIAKWYDQSGNGFDVSQTAQTLMPIIVLNEVLTTDNSLPAIDFDGVSEYLFNNSSLSYSGGVSWYCAINTDFNAADDRIWGDDITGVQGYNIFYSDVSYRVNDNNTGHDSILYTGETTAQQLRSFNFDDSSGDYEYAFDGSNNTGSIPAWTGPLGTSGSANVGVGGAGNGAQYLNGKLQELIIYPNDQSANRTGIETNINDHYSIY